jgi:hypothetical protein
MHASDAKGAEEAQERRDDAEMFTVQQLRAMERPSWNEGRLDDLNRKVDDGIKRLDEERKDLRGEMKAGFEKVDREMKAGFEKVDREMNAGFEKVDREMNAGFEKVDREMKGMQRLMAQGAIALSSSMVVGFVTMATVMVVKL